MEERLCRSLEVALISPGTIIVVGAAIAVVNKYFTHTIGVFAE